MELPAFLLNLQWEPVKINVKDTAWALFRLKLLLCAFPSCGPNSPHSLHFDWNICQKGPPSFKAFFIRCFVVLHPSLGVLVPVPCQMREHTYTHTRGVWGAVSHSSRSESICLLSARDKPPPPPALASIHNSVWHAGARWQLTSPKSTQPTKTLISNS